MLTQGKVAIEILREPEIAEGFPDLIIIQPPVLSAVFQMITSVKTPEYCDVSEDVFNTMSVAGVLGVGIHTKFYYPKFNHSTELTDTSSALKFVALQRANVTFLPNLTLSSQPEDLKGKLLVCPSHQTKFKFNTHNHKDFLWAKNKIEAAYREEFGVNHE